MRLVLLERSSIFHQFMKGKSPLNTTNVILDILTLKNVNILLVSEAKTLSN